VDLWLITSDDGINFGDITAVCQSLYEWPMYTVTQTYSCWSEYCRAANHSHTRNCPVFEWPTLQLSHRDNGFVPANCDPEGRSSRWR
jgi:hypothetical protein